MYDHIHIQGSTIWGFPIITVVFVIIIIRDELSTMWSLFCILLTISHAVLWSCYCQSRSFLHLKSLHCLPVWYTDDFKALLLFCIQYISRSILYITQRVKAKIYFWLASNFNSLHLQVIWNWSAVLTQFKQNSLTTKNWCFIITLIIMNKPPESLRLYFGLKTDIYSPLQFI